MFKRGGGGRPLIHIDWPITRKFMVEGSVVEGKCGGNGGRGGSTSMMSVRGGGWLGKCLMDLNDGTGGGLVDLRVGPPVGVGSGLESGDGVTLEVVIVGEVSCRAKGNLGGDSRGVYGGATL
ncbi:hypothetical protein Tco_1336519 [Tanacetum coccineum]